METINYKSALEESSASLNNIFVPTSVKKATGEGVGLEYHPNINNDTQLYSKIFETRVYHPDEQTLNEFYSTIFTIMNKKELGDIRNVGTVVGTAAMTVLGCFTFGTAAIGGIAGFIFGGTVGRCIATKLQLIRRKKNQRMTQEDLYILKLKCLLEAGSINRKKYKKNINKHRLLVEKTIAESRVALESSVFQDQKTIKGILGQYRKYVMENSVHKSILLSYKLLKESMRRDDMRVLENQKAASKHINEVLIPYVRLVELDKNVLSKNTQSKSLTAYYKIKAFFIKDGIEDLSASFSEFRVTPETLESLKTFLNQEVQTKETDTKKTSGQYVKYVTAEIELKQSSSSSGMSKDVSEKSRATPSPSLSPAGGRRKTGKNAQNTGPSLEEVPNDNDIVQDLHAHMTKDYNFAESQIRSKTALDASEANKTHSPLKPFSAALVNHESFINGATPPDMTRKANVESINFNQTNFSVSKQENSSAMMIDLTKRTNSPINSNIMLSKRESQANTPKPLLKLQSAYQANNGSNGTTEKTPMENPTIRESTIDLAANSPTKSPKKSGRSPLAKLFKRKSYKETKTPRANSSSSEKSDKESVGLSTPEKQVEQAQEEFVVGGEAEELLKKVNSTANDNEIKWERIINTPNITIEKVKPENSPVVLLRCWATIQGFSPTEIFEQIFNTEKRAKWETVTMGLREIEKISDTQHFIYFYVKTPMGISERDFVQKRNYQVDYPEKGSITMSFKSTTHPSVPPVKGRVRAETYFAGYVIRPSKKMANSTDLCILSQVDIKGNIPKTIVNMAAGKAPAEWVNKLTKACEKARQEK